MAAPWATDSFCPFARHLCRIASEAQRQMAPQKLSKLLINLHFANWARRLHLLGAMAEYTPDTPLVARLYCPGCEPDADPTEEILDVLWCEAHSPLRGGLDDALVSAAAYLSGGAEAGGDDNRRWCEIFHRR